MIEFTVFTDLLVAALIVMAWSLVYRESAAYRLVEHIALGTFFGFMLYTGLDTLYTKTIIPLFQTWPIDLVIVAAIGILMWTRVVPKVQWPSRIAIAVLAGVSMAVAVTGAVSGQIIQLITAMGSWTGPSLKADIESIISAVATFTTVLFFTYTREHKGVLFPISRIGRYFMMIGFGAIMGTFLMANVSFSIGQIPKLVTGYGRYVSIVAVIVIAADLLLNERRAKAKAQHAGS
jgi:hypothetical protein